MIKKCFVLAGIIVVIALSTSFAETKKSRLELDYGTSFRLQIFNQTLNPDAGKNLEPVYGLDGSAAGEVMNQYQKSFQDSGKTQDVQLGKDNR